MARARRGWPQIGASGLLAGLILLASPAALARPNGDPTGEAVEAVTPPERVAPVIPAVKAEAGPVIDGVLDEPCWQTASHIQGFWNNDLERPELEPTECFLCYDDQAIYVAFRAHDSRPEAIRAVERKRNGSIWRDDYVTFSVDPDHDHRGFYGFMVTPRGTQCEDIPGGSATKIEWRGDWTAAAQTTEEGWTAEMAIPFAILRYPRGQASFGFHLGRHLAREDEGSGYPYMGKSWEPGLTADWVDLAVPPPVRRPVLMAYGVLGSGGEGDRLGDAGLDFKQVFPNGLTGVATLNPDFENVEEVVESISFTFTERYLPERRPFLAEGNSWFQPRSGQSPWFGGRSRRNLYSSRRIGDIDLGVKTFGQLGPHTIAFLNASKLGEVNDIVACYQHSFSDRSEARVTAIDHRIDGDGDSLDLGLDVYHRWVKPDGGLDAWMELYRSGLQGERGSGLHLNLGGARDRGDGQVSWEWNFRRTEADYDPALGFVTERGVAGGSFTPSYRKRYDTGSVQSWWCGLHSYYFVEDEGYVFKRAVALSVGAELRNGTALDVGYNFASREGQDASAIGSWFGWRQRDLDRNGSIYLQRGTRVGGDYSYVSVRQAIPVSGKLGLSVWAEHARLEEPAPDPFSQYQGVLTAAYDITPEKTVSGRIVAHREGINFFATYRQAVRLGTDIFLLVGDPDPRATGFRGRVAVKLVRAF